MKAIDYDPGFYASRDRRTRHAAGAILDRLFEVFPGIHSAVDVGCGVGTWLAVLHERGVGTVIGYDGRWVQPEQLVIPGDCFRSVDLSHPEEVRADRRFDLAICLEVAEHLPADKAGELVRSLSMLSDLILFSAAIPGQGGVHHLNEQWPDYWAGLFAAHGYTCFDVIRHRIWQDDGIPYWYRQNIVVFARGVAPTDGAPEGGINGSVPLPLVHPALLEHYTQVYAGRAFRLLVSSLGKALRRRLGRWSGPRPSDRAPGG